MPMDLNNPEVSDNKKTKKHSKRTDPSQISNRIIKKPRLVASTTNVAKSIPSTSNAVIQCTQEVASVQSTNEELQPSNSKLNCKDNFSHLNNDKKENGFHRNHCVDNNEYIDNDDTTEKSQEMVEQQTVNGNFWFNQSFFYEHYARLLEESKTDDEEEDDESIIKSSPSLKLPKVDCSSSTSTNSKKSPASENNINSINQPNQVGINKSQKHTIIQQQPSKQTIKSSNITKQQSTSTNISSKMQHSTINQTDPKHHVYQHNNTPLKHTKATAIHIQTSNKQIINSHQLSIFSELVSATKKKVNINQNVKPAIIHQPSVKDVKKCINCKAILKEQICAVCQTFAHLKNISITKIELPSTSADVLPKSPIITSSKPISVPSSSKNSDSCEQPQIVMLLSEDEDEELCSNPKLLEDRLSQKNSGVEYNCQIEGCQSVHNDSFNTIPNCSSRIIEEPMLSITQPTNARFELLEDTTILKDRLGNYYSIIRISDYRMLNTNKFINDILIEFYLNYWYTKKLSDEDRNRTYVFSTHFYSTLVKSFNTDNYPSHYTASQIRYDNVKRWTKNVDIFKKDFVFIPINENNHWFMAVVCFPYLSGKVNMKDGTPVNAPDDNDGRYTPPPTHHHQTDGRNEADPNVEDLWLFDMASTARLLTKQGVDYETDVAVTKKSRQIQVKRPCILLFDSLSGGVQRAKIAATLRCWLEQEYNAKYNGKKDFSPQAIKGALLRLPQQPNYTDCGLFMIHFFKKFFERPIVDYTLPVRHLENWFSIDEVVKNCQKRRELHSIILARMEERGSILPDNMELPIIDFTDPPKSRLYNLL